MKFMWVIAMAFCCLLLSCDNDDYPNANIPSVVLNKFRSSFPEASDVKWKQVKENYEVEFHFNNVDSKLMITSAGNILKQKQEIPEAELPFAVSSFLNNEYGKEKIDDPEKITTGDHIYYQLEINRFFLDKELVVDEKGKILNSVSYWD